MSTYSDNRFKGLDPFPSYIREMGINSGLLCLYGCITLVHGVYDIIPATIDGQDWSGDSDTYPPVVRHLAALIQVIFSLASIGVGFQWLVSGNCCKHWVMLSVLLSFLSAFTYVVNISYISFLAAKDVEDSYFIANIYNPSKTENRAAATLGVLGYIAYAGNNFGALIHLNLKMWRFQTEKWTGYNRGFYRSLLVLFGNFVLIAGITQLALGAYIYDEVEDQRLRQIVLVGPYHVTYPEISMTVGAFQVALGFCMFRRAMRPAGEGGASQKGQDMFGRFAWFVLLLSISAQVLTQAAFAAGKSGIDEEPISEPIDSLSTMAGFATMVLVLVMGLGLFPIYLDTMYHTTPPDIPEGCFSAVAPEETEGKPHADEERKVEATPSSSAAAAAPAAAAPPAATPPPAAPAATGDPEKV